eukprot:CAMPEP_0178939012 /NCGR_PEP_ID=MMETSP0786-20121207/26649_1 /TAXON_ID=186022 /ORGANISM="Thalassionema frauenfeldii, Strain CCMP 1798" /LENGTH=741 /DNA_ID=CAMNT_0020617793 /DNA_START=279 /DNA_END=2503 /DNA_ORIENTATION=+
MANPRKNLTKQPQNVMYHRKRSLRGRALNDKYNVDWDEVLGEGAYGSVHPARLAATGKKVKVALKKISKRYTDSSSFKTETDALLRIYDNGGHPNISGLLDMYEDYSHFYLILDLVSGGEMFEHLINYGAYSEADAARLMYEIASALAFLHGVGVVHADLKPENLLLDSKKRVDGVIKLIDFGCAVVFDDDYVENLDNPSANSNGTTAYWPPERFRKGIKAQYSMDMWAVGVILYIMLTGMHPFDTSGTSTDKEIEDFIQADPNPPINEEYTGHLSQSAIDLIKSLMNPDPNKRITAYEMLNHSWVKGETASSVKIADSDTRLSRFQELRYQLEAGLFAVLVGEGNKRVTLSEAHPVESIDSHDASTNLMKKAFDIFDREEKGYITSNDLSRVVGERTGNKVSASDTKAYIETRQGNKSEMLSLSLFGGLFNGISHKHFPRGHAIFKAGEKGDAMYFLNSGKVEIQTRKGQLVSILRSGDFFGEGSLLSEDRNSRFTTARCATPVDVIEIKRSEFERYTASSESLKQELRVKYKARMLDYAKNMIRLEKNVKQETFRRGELVYKEGDRGKSMYQVSAGDLEVLHDGKKVHMYRQNDSFGESSLLFERPRSSTVRCISDKCVVLKMKGEDFLTVVNSDEEMASTLRNMCRKRLFKKAVKQFSLQKNRGLSDDDIVAAFYDADIDQTGKLSLDEVRRLMHRMDPKFPMEEIKELMNFIDVDQDGAVSLEEFKRLFRQFEDIKT